MKYPEGGGGEQKHRASNGNERTTITLPLSDPFLFLHLRESRLRWAWHILVWSSAA